MEPNFKMVGKISESIERLNNALLFQIVKKIKTNSSSSSTKECSNEFLTDVAPYLTFYHFVVLNNILQITSHHLSSR